MGAALVGVDRVGVGVDATRSSRWSTASRSRATAVRSRSSASKNDHELGVHRVLGLLRGSSTKCLKAVVVPVAVLVVTWNDVAARASVLVGVGAGHRCRSSTQGDGAAPCSGTRPAGTGERSVSKSKTVVSKVSGLGPEGHRGAELSSLGSPLREWGVRHAVRVYVLPPDAALPVCTSTKSRHRQRVHHRDTDAVQAAGDRVAAAAELAAGVQHGQHHLDGRPLARSEATMSTGMPRPSSTTRTPPSSCQAHLDRAGSTRRGPRRRSCPPPRRPGGADRAPRWSRCTCLVACGPRRAPRAP